MRNREEREERGKREKRKERYNTNSEFKSSRKEASSSKVLSS